MKRNFNDVFAFITLAREKSFTRAASKLGISQPALSQTITHFEKQMNVRLLSRTTRTMKLTEAGKRLLEVIGDRFDTIELGLEQLIEMRDKPAGTVRITTSHAVLSRVLLPRLTPFLKIYPDIHMEFDVNNNFCTRINDRFDAGVRLGGTIDKDMEAVAITPPIRMAVVASPEYFSRHGVPEHPNDLMHHSVVNYRLNCGRVHHGKFNDPETGEEVRLKLDGQLTFASPSHVEEACIAGLGIAFLPEIEFENSIKNGQLVRVLEAWCRPFSGYHLYYPTRKQMSSAFGLVLDVLRLKGENLNE